MAESEETDPWEITRKDHDAVYSAAIPPFLVRTIDGEDYIQISQSYNGWEQSAMDETASILKPRVEASHRAELTRLTAEVERYRDLLRRWYEDVGMREVDRMTYPGWRELDAETRTALTAGEQNETVEIAVQVNGRVRGVVKVPLGSTEVEVFAAAIEGLGLRVGVGGRLVYVPDRLLNIIWTPSTTGEQNADTPTPEAP